MAVAQSTAIELVHQIFDLQRVLRCLMAAQASSGAGIGFALQASCGSSARGRLGPRTLRPDSL